MNLFFGVPAQYHGSKHVVKMALEAAQMLYTAHWVLDGRGWVDERVERGEPPPFNKARSRRGFRAMQAGMLLVQWVRESLQNYMYTVDVADDLLAEYALRSCKHSVLEAHLEWLRHHPPMALAVSEASSTLTVPPCYVVKDLVFRPASWEVVHELYHVFYTTSKRELASDLRVANPNLVRKGLEWETWMDAHKGVTVADVIAKYDLKPITSLEPL
ncbi:uncharacterized protein AMSG_03509 [Thecamonas trahens ATCC 50062]|uniref:Uncharacterized protein n=1 Tax=Thecamonas trahens ATCC 50062 TaxID=461836 RepID=A0A0L0D449_THETB|nr:hypothetical protein AMSG_03509 [Thecamonas trahens ATCC 50062]KNC47084.1 hypothetical protein AMSG_03509 [Thecamonas trahens ATCC 50062]|eukprot:XP_013759864.1 hypothetical protein AMSG_03509 [Thecamonas trahens ATCC 50062]